MKNNIRVTVEENGDHTVFVASDKRPAKRLPDGTTPKSRTTPNRSVRHPEPIRQILELSQSLTTYEVGLLTQWAREIRD